MNTKTIILALVLLSLGAAVGYSVGLDQSDRGDQSINSFEECAAAGYPIMESYPEQCRTSDGRNFVREVPEPITLPPNSENEPIACTADAKLCPDGSYVGRTGPNCEFTPCPPPSSNSGKCYIGGCSSQICSDQEGAISTCEYREEYACYQTATCERQSNGQCGWTNTPALRECLLRSS